MMDASSTFKALAGLAGPRPWTERMPHRPWPKQEKFIALDCLEALYGGAAGGGKSDALLLAALQYVHVPGYAAMLFRKAFTDLALPDALLPRAAEWLSGTGARWIERDKTWEFPVASGKKPTLSFGYMDGPRDRFRYQGAALQFAGFDELTQFPEQDYRYIFSRLRRQETVPVPLRMRGATNPGGIGHDWVGQRFGITEDYDPNVPIEGPNGRIFMPARLEDNPALGKDYERSLEELDAVTYQQLRFGKWVLDASETVYSFDVRKNVIDALPVLPDDEPWTRVLSADFGVTDATAFAVWGFTQHDPVAYLLESEEWVGLSPSEAAEIAQEWEARYNGFERIVGDIGGLGKAFAQEWTTRFQIPIEAARKENKLGYIKLMNGDLQRERIKVVRATNTGFIKCAQALRWKDEKRQVEHPAIPNHLTDAGLYGWRECRQWDWEARKEKPQPGTDSYLEQREAERLARWREKYEREQGDDNSWILGPNQ